jgi:hypothetical protein
MFVPDILIKVIKKRLRIEKNPPTRKENTFSLRIEKEKEFF